MMHHPIPSAGATPPEVAIPQQEEEDTFSTGANSNDEEWEDGDWEDEEDLQVRLNAASVPRQTSTGSGTSSRTTPLKRRKAGATFHASRKQGSLPPSPRVATPRPKTQEDSPLSREAVVSGTLKGAVFTSRYAFDVFSAAIHLLRQPLSILLFLWLLVFIIGQFSHTLRTVFSPLCIIPGISRSSLCRPMDNSVPVAPNKQHSQWADYPKLMDVQSKSLNQLMGDSIGGSALSLEIKRAEMATTDLVALVRISDLKSKDSLGSSLTRFVHDAKKTGRGLQKLSAKVGGAVDNIMAMNDYALNSIESARATPWSLSDLSPWKPARQNVINEIVTKTFEDSMDSLSNNMERLIVEAEDSLHNLNSLEERLITLHEIIAREDSSQTFEKAELLAQLWTMLGGNRKELRNFQSNLALLKALGAYRKQAQAHVVAALQTLRSMSDDMEDLRERVAAPNLIGSRVPAEVHMKSIRMGLERLLEGRVRARKLEEEAVRRIMPGNGDDDL